VGFVVDKEALEPVLSEYFGFPCQTFHRLRHRPSSRAGTIGGRVADVPSELSSLIIRVKSRTIKADELIRVWKKTTSHKGTKNRDCKVLSME
jgi:hypothetical protein